ncbi:MAG: bifunctional oligoribonuclease/PAP phosphatase NrnA [Melioribacteraceae bacterium]|nr:bifunctional oligoribonuclease/PAP phosphatase NrnA [Melioribacteraceae bacterium]
MNQLFNELKIIIEKYENFVITTHVNPDADAIGSELALYFLLKKKLKSVKIINTSETPEYLTFLDKDSIIERYKSEIHDEELSKADVLIALDLNQISRTARMSDEVGKLKSLKVCIDHHQAPEDFADLLINDITYTATGEIIFDFIEQTFPDAFDINIAENLYAAIMTDTGSFRFERTTSNTHLIAAKLLDMNVNPTEIYNKIYDQNNYSKLKLLGQALSELKITHDEKLAYMVITQEMLKRFDTKETEVEGFVNYCVSIKGVQMGLLFFELKNGIKISFRSKGNIPVNKLAAEFEGGGHQNAAGARIFDAKLEEYLNDVINAAKKYLE